MKNFRKRYILIFSATFQIYHEKIKFLKVNDKKCIQLYKNIQPFFYQLFFSDSRIIIAKINETL